MTENVVTHLHSAALVIQLFLCQACLKAPLPEFHIIFAFTVNLQRALKNEASASNCSYISYIKEITGVINVDATIKAGLS